MQIGIKTLALFVVVVIAIAVYLTLSGSAPTLSTTATVSLQRNASYNFYLGADHNISSALVASADATGATVYLGSRPLLVGSVLELHLTPGQADNVSLTGSQTADLNIKLDSSSASSATLTLTYIPSGFGVRITPGIEQIGTIGVGKAALATSTVPQSGGTSSTVKTTTVAPTTTVKPVSNSALAMEEANASDIGLMINGYNRIFQTEHTACTQTLYDNEFASQYGMVPSGPLTYANESQQVPQKIISSETSVGTNLYNITYTEVVTSGNRRFAIVQFNLSGNFITTSIFNGDFGKSYSPVFENYTVFNKTSDSCAVWGV